jgi:3-hydroxy acid dehydrogenase/malonic semialdehyde reductase
MPKIVLITGATSGIGKAAALLFAGQGYDLILTGRRKERLEQLSEEISRTYSVNVHLLNFDVRSKAGTIAALGSLPDEWKKVDVLINNAGLSRGLDPVDKGDMSDWDTMIDTNIKGFLYVTSVVSKWMVERQDGHIVNLGSVAGREVYPNGNVYCATKYAVDALNKSMRIDLLPHRIRVTAINPGAVETEFSEVRFNGDKERARKVYEGFVPLSAGDIADAIWYAVSRPKHVNINDILIMPTAQASAVNFLREQ